MKNLTRLISDFLGISIVISVLFMIWFLAISPIIVNYQLLREGKVGRGVLLSISSTNYTDGSKRWFELKLKVHSLEIDPFEVTIEEKFDDWKVPNRGANFFLLFNLNDTTEVYLPDSDERTKQMKETYSKIVTY